MAYALRAKIRGIKSLVNGFIYIPSLSPSKERGIAGVRLINNPFPLIRGREASPLFEGAKPLLWN